MAGRHRGESSRGKNVGISRYTLDPQDAKDLQWMCLDERRSVANAISVLVAEALAIRRRARQMNERTDRRSGEDGQIRRGREKLQPGGEAKS